FPPFPYTTLFRSHKDLRGRRTVPFAPELEQMIPPRNGDVVEQLDPRVVVVADRQEEGHTEAERARRRCVDVRVMEWDALAEDRRDAGGVAKVVDHTGIGTGPILAGILEPE